MKAKKKKQKDKRKIARAGKKEAQTTQVASKRAEVEVAQPPAQQTPLFGLRWLSPVKEEVGVSIWHNWWSECKRLRVTRSVSAHWPGHYAVSYREPISGRLEVLREENGTDTKTFSSLNDALLAARAFHVGILQIEDDDLPDNHLEIVKEAEQLGLDVLPTQAPVDTTVVSNVSGTLRKAQPEVEDMRGKNRFMLLGFPVTAVLRWMGKAGWTAEQAKAVLKAKKIEVAESTLKSQLHGGAVGRRGEPADLTKGQIQELNSLKPQEQEKPSGSTSTRTSAGSGRAQEARQGDRGEVVAGKGSGKGEKHPDLGGGKPRQGRNAQRRGKGSGRADHRGHDRRRRN